jgi:4-amino-4-deoxy-L-arabinose transferase-like glycosyltransferase
MSNAANPLDTPLIGTREAIGLVVILMLALIVRIPGLTESLWYDEIWYSQTFFADPVAMSFLLWKDVHPPSYPLILLAWTDLFGDSEIAVRIPSFLFGMASLVLMWFMARRWVGPQLALLSIALMALSPPHIWYSHENKVNMMVLLFTLYSVWLYWRASETRHFRDWVVATMVLIIALYTHAYAVPVAAVIFLWLGWLSIADRSLVKPLLISGLVIATVFLPLVLFKLGLGSELSRGYLRQLSLGELYKLLLIWLPSGNTLRTISPYSSFSKLVEQPWPYFLIEAFFAFLLGRGMFLFGRRATADGWLTPATNPASTHFARLVLLWFLVPLVFTVAGSLFTEHFYIERNLLVILPPFILILAAGADISPPSWVRAALFIGLVMLALVATVNLRIFKTDEWTVYKYKPDWRSAVSYLTEESRLNDPMWVLVTTPTESISYYKRRISQANSSINFDQEPWDFLICNGTPEELLQYMARSEWSMFYLVKNETWSGCWKGFWESFSNAEQLQLVEQREFKGLKVMKFAVVNHH